MTAWISMLPEAEASPALREALALARTPAGTVDNVMRVHSHRPHTMVGHLVLYRAVLHNDANTVPMWLQEVVASHVSLINQCPYSHANHWKNACHLMAQAGVADAERAAAIDAALRADAPERVFSGLELAYLRYAAKLTRQPGAMVEADVLDLRQHGADDGQILEVNQVVGYFNYVNRLLNGLGVSLKGDVVGYYNAPVDGGGQAEAPTTPTAQSGPAS